MYRCSCRLRATFTWVRLQNQKPYCSKPPQQPHNALSTYNESLKKLDNLDMVTAAKMLFTDPPPKKKKFGLDFIIVQLFIACLPSVAVYLVAQYARYEMRKMEAENEKKTKKQEEEKAEEEIALKAAKEKEARSAPIFLEVKERLEKLEETVKVIAAETKNQSLNSKGEGHEDEASTLSSLESSKPVVKDPIKPDSTEAKPAAGKDQVTGSVKDPNASAE